MVVALSIVFGSRQEVATMNGKMNGEPAVPLQLPVDCTLYVYALFCLFRAQYIKTKPVSCNASEPPIEIVSQTHAS